MSDRGVFWVDVDGVVMDANAIHYIEPDGWTYDDEETIRLPLTRVHFVACLDPFIYQGSVAEFCHRVGIFPVPAIPARERAQDAL